MLRKPPKGLVEALFNGPTVGVWILEARDIEEFERIKANDNKKKEEVNDN